MLVPSLETRFFHRPVTQAPHITQSVCLVCSRVFYAPTSAMLELAERSHVCHGPHPHPIHLTLQRPTENL